MSRKARLSKKNDDRLGERVWADCIYIAMKHGLNTTHHGWDLDLAFVVNEANIMRIVARIACEQAGIQFDELMASVRETIDGHVTKKARVFFEKARQRYPAEAGRVPLPTPPFEARL